MKTKYKITGNKLVIRLRFGHIHMIDFDSPITRLMWITARSQKHADRLTRVLRWQGDKRLGFTRETYYDRGKKQLISRVTFS